MTMAPNMEGRVNFNFYAKEFAMKEEPEITPRPLPSDELRSPSTVAKRFDRSLPWVWLKVKNDPKFPKPVYHDGIPFFIEREIGDYITKNFVAQSSDRAARARLGRQGRN